MWFDEAGDAFEMFRGGFPLSVFFLVPILIIISSPMGSVSGSQEFSVYRMQHYDLHGSHHGCRNAIVNVEARPIGAQVYTRRCVVARLMELTSARFKEMVDQNAGGLLVLLPPEGALTDKERQRMLGLEEDLMEEETNLPVYFTYETPDIARIYDDVEASTNTDSAPSAVQALLSSVSANGFQMVVNGPQAKVLTDFQITNIQGKLTGYGIEEQLPTIAVAAHYDSFGIAPSLSTGADSNGSGVVALLELARIFSKLYTNSRTHAKFNILFLLSGGGKFNYQGTKRWIDDNLDNSDSSLLSEVQFVLCLDSIGAGKEMYLHVSKPPKEGTSGADFLRNLRDATAEFHPDVKVDLVHKKINLADDTLSWEHERFSIRRLPAFTLSRHSSHNEADRKSILDTRSGVDVSALSRNIRLIAEALSRHVYNTTARNSPPVFSNSFDIQESVVGSTLDIITSQSRAAQLMNTNHAILSTLEQYVSKYLKDVHRTLVKADKRDPDFVFYDGAEYRMFAYSVKPAIFDLFIALGIVGYLGLVYLIGQNFPVIYNFLKSVSRNSKAKVH